MLACLAPALLLDRLAGWGFVAAAAALGLVALLSASGSALGRAWTSCRPALPGAIVLLAIPVLQLLPWAPSSLASPIWDLTAQALQIDDIGRSISLDPAATLASLTKIAALLAFTATTALVAADRTQASQLYRAACLSAALTVALLIAGGWLGLIAADIGFAAEFLGSLCIIMATALGAATQGRAQARSSAQSMRINLVVAGATALAGVAALAIGPSLAGLVTTIAGAAICVVATRLKLPRFGTRTAAVISLLVTVLAGTAILAPSRGAGAVLASAPRPERTMQAADTQRMLADTLLLGAGDGSFDRLAELYGGGAETSNVPTAALRIYVEDGPVGWLALLAGATFLALKLLAGAARRGRDRHYAASAAASVLVAIVGSAWTAGPALAAPQVVMAMVIGIGLAQRRSAEA